MSQGMGHFKFLIVPMALGWSTYATAQTVYEKVLADTVGQYSSVVSVVAKGTGGVVLLAEYVNWPDTADSGFRLFEVDDMGEVIWSHAITFPSLGWPGGHEPYLTTHGRSRVLVARNDGSGYTFVGKAPAVQGRGLLVSTDLAGAVTWSATTEVVPNGIAQAANGDVLVYGWDSLQSFSTRVERYDPSGTLLWSQLNPVAFGPAWSGAATLNDGLLIFHGFGLERRLSQLDASGNATATITNLPPVTDLAAGPAGDHFLASTSLGNAPYSHFIQRVNAPFNLLPVEVVVQGLPTQERIRSMVVDAGGHFLLTGSRRSPGNDSDRIVMYEVDANYQLVRTLLLDPGELGTHPTWSSAGHCLTICPDGGVVLGGIADDDDAGNQFATGYYAKIMDTTSLSINASGGTTSLGIAPNPSDGRTSIIVPSDAPWGCSLEVRDAVGRVVHRTASHRGAQVLDLSHLAKGIYPVALITRSGRLLTSGRIVIP